MKMSISIRSKHYNGTKNAMKGSALDMHYGQPDRKISVFFDDFPKEEAVKNRGETDLETRKKVLYLFDCVDNFTSLATQIWVI